MNGTYFGKYYKTEKINEIDKNNILASVFLEARIKICLVETKTYSSTLKWMPVYKLFNFTSV